MVCWEGRNLNGDVTVNRILIAIAAVATVATSVPAAALVNARQLNQERNIDAGVRSGKLTQREARSLRAEVRAIAAQKAALTRDGRYSQRDKNIIHARQDRLAHRIDRLKANGRRGK